MKEIVLPILFLLAFTGGYPVDKLQEVKVIEEVNGFEDNKEEVENKSGVYDGSLLAIDQKTGTIYILDPANKNLKDGILWSLAPNELKGLNGEQLVHKGGADAKWVLEGTHILAICAPYIALIRIEDKTAVFYAKNGGGNPHSVELLPDGNIVSANSDGKSLKFFATGKGNDVKPVEYTFGGAHGVVWDDKRKGLWAIGGDKLWLLEYNFDKENPMISDIKQKHTIEASGHDLYPIPGADKLYFTSKNLWVFNIETGEQTKFLEKGGIKSVSQNGVDGEIIYTYGLGSKAKEIGLKKWQTPHITTLDGNKRTLEGAGFYKARWFVPCPFSYPEQ